VILLFGIPSEPPVAMVRRRLIEMGEPVFVLNQRDTRAIEIELNVADGLVGGWLRAPGARVRLEDVGSVYARPMDDRFLPELENEPPQSAARLRSRRLHDAIVAWLDVTPARVVNRFRESGSNGSKPFQSQLVQQLGFRVPETLITNDPRLVIEFRRRHGRVIYKSVSATRSIVHELGDDELERLGAIRVCPVQFQAYVPGFDVRVHVAGKEVLATRVDSPATDYRYGVDGTGAHAHDEASLTPFDLPADVAERCRSLTAGLGLAFSGIDLRFTPDAEVVCFEVNPSPAYSYYELHTGQAISLALARYLAGARRPSARIRGRGATSTGRRPNPCLRSTRTRRELARPHSA
jgi:hypothetical protein